MILEQLKLTARSQVRAHSTDAFTIRGIWKVNCLFQPFINERCFVYTFIVSQTAGQGCAYCTGDKYSAGFLESLIGRDYFSLESVNRCLDISLLDSVYASFQFTPQMSVCLEGNSTDKSYHRADIVVSESMRLCRKIVGLRKPRIANIGVVGAFLKKFLESECEVTASDLDERICGKLFFGKIPVQTGSETLGLVSNSDVAVVTGMTLSTNTLDDIISVAQESGTRVLIFAETGAHFAEEYLKLGVDCVISEPFPFYIFEGKSQIDIFRAVHKGI